MFGQLFRSILGVNNVEQRAKHIQILGREKFARLRTVFLAYEVTFKDVCIVRQEHITKALCILIKQGNVLGVQEKNRLLVCTHG